MALASPAADCMDPTRESLFCCLPRTIQKLFQGSCERCPAFVGSGHQEASSGPGLDVCGCSLCPTLAWLKPSLRGTVSANTFLAHFLLASRQAGEGQARWLGHRAAQRGQLIYLVSTLGCDNTKHPLGTAKQTCFSGDGRKFGGQLLRPRGGLPLAKGREGDPP